MAISEPTTRTAELLALERKYCSFGDTVHYLEPPKIFVDCEGSHLYDEQGTPYLDLQMWYSAASFGYKNQRLGEALKRQVDRLPQLACQYLHAEKVEVAARIAQYCEKRFGVKGRVHFNVGGAQAIEDSLKLVRNYTGKNLMFAFHGRLSRPHAGRFRHHFQLSLPAALRTLRRPRAVCFLSLLFSLHL